MYPNARNMRRESGDHDLLHTVVFETNDSRAAVNEYYEKNMALRGWSQVNKGSNYSPTFSKMAPLVPWRSSFDIYSVVLHSGVTEVTLVSARLPDQNNIPVIQCANNFTSKTLDNATGRFRTHVITYQSTVSPDAMKEYYNSVMTEIGWKKLDETSQGDPVSMIKLKFGYSFQAASFETATTYITITTHDNVTEVEIGTQGTGITPH
jgi:hypothetical protein